MGLYYYLASQLPYLIFGQKAPMSSVAFKELANTLLNAKDAYLLEMLEMDPQPLLAGDDVVSYANTRSSGSDFIDGWWEWERTLRLNAARHRAIKTMRENGAPVEPPAFPTDAAAAAVKAVVAIESPLDAEVLIDKARWHAIEVLAGNDYFDRNTIFAYFLKLVLLERQEKFKAEEGFAEYKSLYASILESAQHPVGEPK